VGHALIDPLDTFELLEDNVGHLVGLVEGFLGALYLLLGSLSSLLAHDDSEQRLTLARLFEVDREHGDEFVEEDVAVGEEANQH